VVGVLFLAAVVFSIFASDYGLGNREFELVEMVAPPDMAAAEPNHGPRHPQTASRSTSQLPTRQVNMQDVSQSLVVPKDVSVIKNSEATRPYTTFVISDTILTRLRVARAAIATRVRVAPASLGRRRSPIILPLSTLRL